MNPKLPNIISKELTDKFQVLNNTLIRDVKENPKDRITLEIGDSKQPDFYPQAKLCRWDNEVNFSLRAQEHPLATVETISNKIIYKTPDYEVHLYDKPEVTEDGGFEFEWVLKEKPASNVLTATIQTKGLNFFFQPPLTQQEIDEGASRPENVVGSYAVYHATKGGMNDAAGMEYKVGKAFHIYRPKVTDANGNEIWGELNIDEQNGLLTITIDQDWLDNAVYPVIVDPTFGFITQGASSTFYSTSHIEGSKFTCPENGTLDNIIVWTGSSSWVNTDIAAGIYKVSDSAWVDGTNRLATFSLSTPNKKTCSPLQNSAAVTNQDYWIVIWSSEANSAAFDAGDTGQGVDWNIGSSPGAGNPLIWTTPIVTTTTNTNKYSIYATYTAAGGAIPNKIVQLNQAVERSNYY